ncbi:MAG: hypothetical protein HYV09_06625 [Deltaproteobacteria bacterium]|nr:hypothetical protein [Deltaproteobacteria bacterium]
MCNLGNKQCEPPTATASDESDGGCTVGARGTSPGMGLAPIAFMIAIAIRRRRDPRR